jgi:beta-phosphoglucomutase-like phosphatase (HAD superfamily)
MIRAIVFDVDGTMAETEELHRQAFNEAFAEQGLDWSWDRLTYARLLATTGGRERIMVHASSLGTTVDVASSHRRKTEIYNQLLREGGIALRPGIAPLIAHARAQGLRLAIGTTTSRPNVVSLLDVTLGEGSANWFASIRTGEDVSAKKPDPEVYHLVLSDLDLKGAECLCIEDSRNGLRAALAAGMPTVVTPSLYSAGEDFTGASLIVEHLSDPLPTSSLPKASPAGAPLPDLLGLLRGR